MGSLYGDYDLDDPLAYRTRELACPGVKGPWVGVGWVLSPLPPPCVHSPVLTPSAAAGGSSVLGSGGSGSPGAEEGGSGDQYTIEEK